MYPSVIVPANGVECRDVLYGPALTTGLLSNLPDESLLDGLTDLDDASWYPPLTLTRFSPPLNKDNFLSSENDPCNPGDGMDRIFSARRTTSDCLGTGLYCPDVKLVELGPYKCLNGIPELVKGYDVSLLRIGGKDYHVSDNGVAELLG